MAVLYEKFHVPLPYFRLWPEIPYYTCSNQSNCWTISTIVK